MIIKQCDGCGIQNTDNLETGESKFISDDEALSVGISLGDISFQVDVTLGIWKRSILNKHICKKCYYTALFNALDKHRKELESSGLIGEDGNVGDTLYKESKKEKEPVCASCNKHIHIMEDTLVDGLMKQIGLLTGNISDKESKIKEMELNIDVLKTDWKYWQSKCYERQEEVRLLQDKVTHQATIIESSRAVVERQRKEMEELLAENKLKVIDVFGAMADRLKILQAYCHDHKSEIITGSGY